MCKLYAYAVPPRQELEKIPIIVCNINGNSLTAGTTDFIPGTTTHRIKINFIDQYQNVLDTIIHEFAHVIQAYNIKNFTKHYHEINEQIGYDKNKYELEARIMAHFILDYLETSEDFEALDATIELNTLIYEIKDEIDKLNT